MEKPYIPSRLLPGETGRIRELGFTRWMSRDLRQAAIDFCKNIGLTPIYAECAPDCQTRYLFWNPGKCFRIEVRSGRTQEQFEAFDRVNNEKAMALLTLHISEDGVHSGVWISPDGFEAAVAMLAVHGITPARRNAA
jgi:hypothetical protein